MIQFNDLAWHIPAAYADDDPAAPGDVMPIVARDEARVAVSPARWGFVPSWSQDPSLGAKLINANASTLPSGKAFGDAYREGRRCIVPASGFFAWARCRWGYRPFLLRSRDDSMLAFAGLYAPAGDDRGASFAIVVTASNALVRPFQNRMPLVLDPGEHAQWLEAPDASVLLGKRVEESVLMAQPISERRAHGRRKVRDVEHAGSASHFCTGGQTALKS